MWGNYGDKQLGPDRCDFLQLNVMDSLMAAELIARNCGWTRNTAKILTVIHGSVSAGQVGETCSAEWAES